MMYRSFTTREKVLLLILALLLVGMAYYTVIHVPVTTQLSEIAIEKSEAEADVMIAQVKNVQLERMREELETLSADAASVAPVPAYDNVQNLMNLLNQTLAATNNFSVSFDAVDTSEQFIRRTIHLTYTSADYNAAKNVVSTLLGGPYRCQASDFSLSAADGGVTVTMAVTFFEAQEDLPAVPAEAEPETAEPAA